MLSTSKPPVLGEPEEQHWQRVAPFQRHGERGFDLQQAICFTGDDELWHPSVPQDFGSDMWLPLLGSSVEDDEFHWSIDSVMNTPKYSSPELGISQDFSIPTLSADGNDTDSINLPRHTAQVHKPIRREIEETAGIEGEPTTKSRKRSRTEAFSMDQLVNDSIRPRQAPKIDADNEKMRTQFACPYQKRDSFRHHGCLKYELNRIKDVKQHVYRRHKQPDYYCAFCFHTFKSADARDKHTRSKKCHNKIDTGFEGITDAQKKELNKSTSRGLAPEEQWFRMWDIIFPNEIRPNSVRVGTYMEEMVPLLRSLWANKSPSILDQAQKKQGVQLSGSLLNGVVESIFDCLEAETSATLMVGKPTYATCPQIQHTLVDGQWPMATTPFRIIDESHHPLFDEPYGMKQDPSEDAKSEFEKIHV